MSILLLRLLNNLYFIKLLYKNKYWLQIFVGIIDLIRIYCKIIILTKLKKYWFWEVFTFTYYLVNF